MARKRFRLTHALEGAVAIAGYSFFEFLPLDWASGLGGFLARKIGPRLGLNKRARKNLSRAMPELSPDAIERIIAGMWDNLGRLVAEYPHLGAFRVYDGDGRVEIVGAENIRAQAAGGKGAIFFSGHFGNWEVAPLAVTQAGLGAVEIYRPANNPLVDKLLNRARSVIGTELVPKGTVAARRAIAALQEGRHIAMLVDQKMNDGIAVPFFGHDAMTAPALAQLALRFDCAIMPARVERLKGARFRIVMSPPIEITPTGDRQADTLAIMTAVNAEIESWLRERPEMWLWLHRRWPD
jgi:KDO2-lipid IV(A) lauroyltransferase